jgi:putative peptide zinc metalloprotease protein
MAVAPTTSGPVTSAYRPLPFRARRDMTAVRRVVGGRPTWFVKNPLKLDYFLMTEEDHFLWQLLDGRRSMVDLKRAFEARFPRLAFDDHEARQTMIQLHRGGLVTSDAAGQGRELYSRAKTARSRKRRAVFMNLFAIRFRGVDPDRVFTAVDRFFKPLVGWKVLAAVFVAALVALSLLVIRWDRFSAQLPTMQEFFTLSNVLWMLALTGVIKVLHEFGHGLTLKRFGGECRELGLMLLIFTPTLYCRTSDAWLIESRWRRAAIDAAGMYVEIVVAGLASLVWFATEPGLANSLALNVIFLCTVGTIVFNGNPLMRFDGYYLLGDLIDVPNFGQTADGLMREFVKKHLLGIDPPHDPHRARRAGWYVAYAAASWVYRWTVTLTILAFLNQFLEPHRLDSVGGTLAVLSLAGMFLQPAAKLVRLARSPGAGERVNFRRASKAAAVAAALVGAFFFLPLPYRVHCRLELTPHEARNVYVETPGTLAEVFFRPGTRVEADAVLAKLENHEVRLAAATLENEEAVRRAELSALARERFADPAAAAEWAVAKAAIESYQELLARRRRAVERLTLRAPIAGTVLPPPPTPKPAVDAIERGWWGRATDDENRGATLAEGTLLCRVGDAAAYDATLLVDQADLPYLAEGFFVQLLLDGTGGTRHEARIATIAPEPLEVRFGHDGRSRGTAMPPTGATADAAPANESSGSGGAGGEAAEAGDDRRTYVVRTTPIRAADGGLAEGITGSAKVHVAPQTLARRAWRQLRQFFYFEL